MTLIVLLGAPGAGKGTQATVLSERLGVPHVATGDLFRTAIRNDTALGRQARQYMDAGQLVPDDVTIRMLQDRLDQPDASGGAILDGFPRTANQAVALDSILRDRGVQVDDALLIDVPTDELMGRLAGRWICAASGHPYHERTHPPRQPGICDIDGSPLIQRDDDRAETVRARLESQLPDFRAVVEHYRSTGALRSVDGSMPPADVTDALLAALARPGRGA